MKNLMVDEFLKLHWKLRRLKTSDLTVELKDKLFNEIPTLTDKLHLDKVDTLEERVKIRSEYIKKHPNEVFWDYAEYAAISSLIREMDVPDREIIRSCKISTKGDVVTYNSADDVRLYVYPAIRLDGILYQIHRLVASTFIEKPERHADKPYKDLAVYHINFNKCDNRIENLEWLTMAEMLDMLKNNKRLR